jgi:hypothetical protein
MGNSTWTEAGDNRKHEKLIEDITSQLKTTEGWQDQKPDRRLSDTFFDYTNPKAAKTKLRPELSIYGDLFQSFRVGRRMTVERKHREQKIDKDAYQKRPAEFTEEMKIEYGRYKAAGEEPNAFRQWVNNERKALGGLENMTRADHQWMMKHFQPIRDLQTGRNRANTNQFAQNVSVFGVPVAGICAYDADVFPRLGKGLTAWVLTTNTRTLTTAGKAKATIWMRLVV